ncbi:MAG: urease accessory UreF family protein [Pseudomonadota bacterium]
MTTRTDAAAASAAEEDLALLRLTQWLSPAFPLGSFAYSHGLETAISEGDVADAAGLEVWLDHILRFGSGRSDAILLHACLRGEDPDTLADLARALAPSAERLRETEEQGGALARTVAALGGPASPARPLPVALGVAARELGLAPARIVALYLQSFASNLVSCATRAVPLGQTEAQAVLTRLGETVAALARDTQDVPCDRIASSAFGADLASLRHETLPVRIYKT